MVPHAAKATQNAEGGHKPTKEQLAAQNAWLWYVEQLESGEATDPSGQYVRKSTEQESGRSRYKFDGFDKEGPTSDWGFAEYMAQRPAGGTPTLPACVDCDISGGGGGGGGGSTGGGGTGGVGGGGSNPAPLPPGGYANGTGGIWVIPPGPNSPGIPGGVAWGPRLPPPTTIFLSSEGVGGTGDILDLKITKGGNPGISPLPGYHKIALDLNRGAGGRCIYVTFTRDRGSVQLGNETNWGWTLAETEGPVRAVQVFGAATGISLGWVFGNTPIQGFVPTWAPNPIPGVDWKEPDYNDGAGGEYLYGYQFKDVVLAPNQPIEVGVIASNASRPVPPAGWTPDYTRDLNERAGGDYIYYCYKIR